MVARGDLGVELPVQNVPPIQKRLVRKCRAAAKPVIVATQMLESMIDSPMPTRAEVSDVAAAIYEGADAVNAVGRECGGLLPGRGGLDDGPQWRWRSRATRPTVTSSTPVVAGIKHSGGGRDRLRGARNRRRRRTSRRSAARRNRATPPFSWPAKGRTWRSSRLTPLIGTRAAPRAHLGGPLRDHLRASPLQAGGCQRGARRSRGGALPTRPDQIVVTAGVPFNKAGTTNILRVAPCEERLIFATDPD